MVTFVMAWSPFRRLNADDSRFNTETTPTEFQPLPLRHPDSYGTMHAETESYAKSIAHTHGVANAKGTGHTRGYSEGLEPILEDRPTAVHSLQNMIHKAAEKL